MNDLINGIRHQNFKATLLKNFKKLPVFVMFIFIGLLVGKLLTGKTNYFEFNAESIGAVVAILLVWLVDMLRSICKLSTNSNDSK